MVGIKHATKRQFARSTTRRKTISSGISAEYTSLNKQLNSLSISVKSFIDKITAAREDWTAIARSQHHFALSFEGALPIAGPLRDHAKEATALTSRLQRLLLENESSTAPHLRMIAVLEGYNKQIQDLLDDCLFVETSYTEVLRYQKKVDKLQKNASRHQSQLARNLEKLSVARAEHQVKVDDIIIRMHNCFDKHQLVFQCAHHSFWIVQDNHLKVINEVTATLRAESVALSPHLLNVDINSTEKLNLPSLLPSLPMIMAAEANDNNLEITSGSAASSPRNSEVTRGASPYLPKTPLIAYVTPEVSDQGVKQHSQPESKQEKASSASATPQLKEAEGKKTDESTPILETKPKQLMNETKREQSENLVPKVEAEVSVA